ncbi:hypothetical protein NB037_10845 [Rathayibacter sp. ZW T2_19]|uniref:Peptidoglycan binding domain-containing protein n=1 Tax=Rathayibacter rubneri TaxID=2950106 RepID=A0A9X2ITU7_9MICO|nr:hypothetical protein [Rathayibacter rubneri]MCM6762913.1 hypothetical protein [Rathayibacter rubneri]
MSGEPHPRVRLPAVVRPRALAVFVVVVLLVGSAGVVIGASMPSTAEVDEAAVQAPPQVDAAVERRSIDPPRMLQGLVDAGDTRKVAFGGVSGGVLPYVTEVGTASGSPLSNGRLLIAVADQPRIALHVGAPLYRDLHVGDQGRDVQAFETALEAVVPGDFDVDEDFTANTLAAAEELWDGLGYDLPTRPVDAVAVPPSASGATTTATTAPSAPVPAASAPAATAPPSAAPAPDAAARTQAYIDVTQIVQLPSDSVGVLSVLAVGATASADAPLATLQTSPRRVVARASVLDAEEFAVGASVTLRVNGRSDQSGVVARQGEFVASDGSAQSIAGRDVFVDLPADWADLAEKSTVMLTTVEAGEPVLAVPLAAVHDASTAPFVVSSGGSRSDPGEHVPIEVLGSGAGWVRIGEESGLVEGDRVVVGP